LQINLSPRGSVRALTNAQDYSRFGERIANVQLISLRTEVRRGRKRSEETRYFVSSLQATPLEMLRAIRGHWSIENGLHWILDIAFREDECRVRKDHAATNFAVLRHIAVNLLNRARNGKDSIKTMRLRAGWDESFLAQVIAH
jgi:predicted transposase YbfD/YdcC